MKLSKTLMSPTAAHSTAGALHLPHYTLCIIIDRIDPLRVLLGYKHTGFGTGKYTGFGGKVEPGETIEAAALRELWEESSLRVDPDHLQPVGELRFVFPHKPAWSQMVYVFLASQWDGEPQRSDEMTPTWFRIDHIPYQRMWGDGAYWLPPILAGGYIRGDFTFWHDAETITSAEIEVVYESSIHADRRSL